MKKLIRIFFLLCIVFTNIDVYASTNTFERTAENNYLVTNVDISGISLEHILTTPAVDATEKVYDFANLYTDSQEKKLYNIVTDYIDVVDMDLAIVTIDSNQKTSTEAYAQDFYDYNSFGFNDTYDGILFLIDMQNREFYMVTTGYAITMYTDARIDLCLDEAFDYIASGDYYNGTVAFIDKAQSFAEMGAPDSYGNEPKVTGKAKLAIMPWSSIFFGALITTIVVMFILIKNNKLVRQANSSRHYLSHVDINTVNEVFLGRNVHSSRRVHSSSSSGGGGGSSISRGSSGRSHGGGGRKF